MSSVDDFIHDESVTNQCVDMEMTLNDQLNEKVRKLSDCEPQTMGVYLRIRPFSKEELSNWEDQECVVIEDEQTVTLNAPKGSATMKSSEKGIGLSIHKFSFTQHISGHQYEAMDVKPYLRNDAQFLTSEQVKQEKGIKASVFASCKEDTDCSRGSDGSRDSCCSTLETVVAEASGNIDGQFALWVAFFEIYNESVFDLLQPSLCCKSKRRAVLRVFSLCDLAGSERCNKTKTFGERLKEAANINNSLLILGKCITALRNNQSDRSKGCVPFRESKLTKLFQSFFCGKGKASMIVNINQCASTYDETLHVMKFSAVAKQVVQVMPERDGRTLLRPSADVPVTEGYLPEEELLDDVFLMPQDELRSVVENLKALLLAERRKNLVQEMEIRSEMGDAMMQQILESEELRSRQIEELKESYQEKLENTFEMYKNAIKEHAYQSAMRNLEDDYVPLDKFTAEQEKVEELKRQLKSVTGRSFETTDQSTQTSSPKETEAAEERCKRLYKEKSALESICESKQELILSLEKSLKDLTEGHQWLTKSLTEKSREAETVKSKAEDMFKSLEEVLLQNSEKDKEIEFLRGELEKTMISIPMKPKRSLFANIKDSCSPRTLRNKPAKT
uniref:Kinesin motor domain-containing protein n=1 Tax=Knipowitschia caucasica TaxID=637954 RepID=A0AAV2L2N8_KNICA